MLNRDEVGINKVLLDDNNKYLETLWIASSDDFKNWLERCAKYFRTKKYETKYYLHNNEYTMFKTYEDRFFFILHTFKDDNNKYLKRNKEQPFTYLKHRFY